MDGQKKIQRGFLVG